MLTDLKLGPAYDGLLFLVEAARNPPIIRSHRHVELEVNLVVRGSVNYLLGRRRFSFGPRTLVWLFPAQEHQVVARSSDAQSYVAVFKPDLIRRACRSAAYKELKRRKPAVEGIVHTILSPQTFDLVRKTMDALMAGALDPDLLNQEAGFGAASSFRFEHTDPDGLNAGLQHLLLLCWRYQSTGRHFAPQFQLHPAVEQAVELINASGRDLSLHEIARRSGSSGWHLSRLFKRQVGLSLIQYRNSIRLNHFIELRQRARRRTLLEDALASGFGSYAQFHRVFTRTFGCGPRRSLENPRSGRRKCQLLSQ